MSLVLKRGYHIEQEIKESNTIYDKLLLSQKLTQNECAYLNKAIINQLIDYIINEYKDEKTYKCSKLSNKWYTIDTNKKLVDTLLSVKEKNLFNKGELEPLLVTLAEIDKKQEIDGLSSVVEMLINLYDIDRSFVNFLYDEDFIDYPEIDKEISLDER